MTAELHIPAEGLAPVGEPPRPVELYLPPSGYSLEQHIAAFLASPAFTADTAAAYRRDLLVFVTWCRERQLDPLTLGLPEIQVYGRWLMETPSPRTGQLRDNKTVARMMNAVSSLYTYLGRAGAMHYHPAARADRPKYDRRTSKTRSINEVQARTMLALAPTHAPRTWQPGCAQVTMHMMVDLGARVSELCNSDLDHLGHRTDHTGTEWRVIELHMKGNKIRIRPIPAQLGPMLDAWRIQRWAPVDERALLVDRDGYRITRYQIEYLIVVLAKAAGIEDPDTITPHSCRHAFNTIAKARGANLEDRQHALGHASPDTTQLYDHTEDNLATDPAHLVAAATFAPIDPTTLDPVNRRL